MSWQLVLFLLTAGFLGLIFLGIPIVYSLLTVNVVGAYWLMGGVAGLQQIVLSSYNALAVFTLLPITLFILMGEIMFKTGVAQKMIDTVETWLGKVPGRLSLVSILTGTLFAALSGSSMGSAAMLGSSLLPSMNEKGYSKSMSVCPILGAGGLSVLIPPTGLGVILAVVAKVSVGDMLLAIIVPGLTLAVLYIIYIIVRVILNPSIAPAYDFEPIPLSEKLFLTAKYVLPLGIIVFLVVGTIYTGIGTPSEAAALGAVGSFALACIYNKKVDLKVLWDAAEKSLSISVMVLTILIGGSFFSQLLAYSGASHALAKWAVSLPVPPMGVVVIMCLITTFLGMFINGAPLIMITIPIFMPVIIDLGFEPLWFSVIILIIVEVAQVTPPYGTVLFVLKGVAPEGISMQDIIRAAIPCIIFPFAVVGLIMVFPEMITALLNQ